MHPDPRRRSKLVPLIALSSFAILGVAGVIGRLHLDGVAGRLALIEADLAGTPEMRVEIERALEAELAAVRAELGTVRGELEVARASEAVAQELAGRLAGAETRLLDMAVRIEAQGTSLEELTEVSSSIAPSLEERMRNQAHTMVELWRELRETVDDTRQLAADSAARMESFRERDVHRMWNELVGPTVQLSGDESVGSGVLLRSRLRAPGTPPQGPASVAVARGTDDRKSGVGVAVPRAATAAPAGDSGARASHDPSGSYAASGESSDAAGLGGGEADDATTVYDTYVMTAWHVVRDIVVGDLGKPVPVAVYAPDGSVAWETATLLAHDAPRDVALLRLDTDRRMPFGAELARPSRLATESIFDSIYAVGCPLGNDPIPTPGEIATRRHIVDGVNYWMINAPTYIGNSGGGIFDANTHELLGIFSKIYTHGTLRPTIVPHLGLVTPLDDVYQWLAEEGYGFLVPDEDE